jgi:hypothetical protein
VCSGAWQPDKECFGGGYCFEDHAAFFHDTVATSEGISDFDMTP